MYQALEWDAAPWLLYLYVAMLCLFLPLAHRSKNCNLFINASKKASIVSNTWQTPRKLF